MIKKANELAYIIPPVWSGRTLESFLRNELHLSRGYIRILKKSLAIELNSQPAWVTHRLQGGERLVIKLIPLEQDIVPEALPLAIIYEDDDVVAINKTAGMVVHPVGVHKNGTMANALVHHWLNTHQSASFHPVHRLDRFTSGVIVIAKNPWAHQQLSLQVDAGHFHRLYLAICQGAPPQKSAKISTPLKLSGEGFRWEASDDGKTALTRYRVLQQIPGASLIAVKLLTGRSHQIRAHFAYLGIPLYGDAVYDKSGSENLRPALHAVRLTFIHPRFHTRLQFTAPLPEELEKILSHTGLRAFDDIL